MINRLLVCFALEEERHAFLSLVPLDGKSETPYGLMYRGRKVGVEIFCLCCGVGKVLSASAVQYSVDQYRPELIVLGGIGGSLNRDYALYDAVLARDVVQHDLQSGGFGFKRGEIPYQNLRYITAETQLVQRLYSRLEEGDLPGKIHLGRILTGDSFLTSEHLEKDPGLFELEGDVVDMEGASVALVASKNQLPFLLLRTISDSVVTGRRGRFPRACRDSGRYTAALIKALMLT